MIEAREGSSVGKGSEKKKGKEGRGERGLTRQVLLDVTDDHGLGDNVGDSSVRSNNRNTVRSTTTKRLGHIIKCSTMDDRLEAMTTSQIGDSNFNIRNLWDVDNDILQTHVLGFPGLLSMDNKGNEI